MWSLTAPSSGQNMELPWINLFIVMEIYSSQRQNLLLVLFRPINVIVPLGLCISSQKNKCMAASTDFNSAFRLFLCWEINWQHLILTHDSWCNMSELTGKATARHRVNRVKHWVDIHVAHHVLWWAIKGEHNYPLIYYQLFVNKRACLVFACLLRLADLALVVRKKAS